MSHVSDQQMVECFQSAYRKNHSTETALLYVKSAVKTAMDKKQGTILLLVAFSSAFDTINDNILIRRLRLPTACWQRTGLGDIISEREDAVSSNW